MKPRGFLFGKIKVNGRGQNEILPAIDELITMLQVTNPRLYNSVIRKL